MNIERVKQLRDYLAGLKPAKFDLSVWFGDAHSGTSTHYQHYNRDSTNAQALEGSCGTCACIAGHALALFAPTGTVPLDPEYDAADLLGLGSKERDALFIPEEPESEDEGGTPNYLPYPMDREDVRLSQAIQVLDHLIETGKIDWQILDQPGEAILNGSGGDVVFNVHTGRVVRADEDYRDIIKVDVKDLWNHFGNIEGQTFDILDASYETEDGDTEPHQRDRHAVDHHPG